MMQEPGCPTLREGWEVPPLSWGVPAPGSKLAVLLAKAAPGPAVLRAAWRDMMGFPVEKWEPHVNSSAGMG